MTELDQELADRQQEAITCSENLLRLYSFEVGGYTADQLLSRWLASHSAEWVRLAIVEALYQGRYKSVSVEQILAFWRRRGAPLPHFNYEFDRMVCSKFPRAMPSRLGNMKLFKPLFPNLGERSSSPRSQPVPSPTAADVTPAARRREQATLSTPGVRSLVASTPSIPAPSEPGEPKRGGASGADRVLPTRPPIDRSLTRSLQLFPERQPRSSADPRSALQLPMFPMLRLPNRQPESDRQPDNVVPLPIRPTSQSTPSSQVGSYDLRTESGRQQFMQTMLGMLSQQTSLSPQSQGTKELTLWSNAQMLSDPQVLDVTARTADSPEAEPESPGTLRFLPSARSATEPADATWIQEDQAQDVQAQDVQVQDVQADPTSDRPEVLPLRGDRTFPIPLEASIDLGMIHQFTPRTTSSPFDDKLYDKLKAVLPISEAAGTDAMPHEPPSGPPIAEDETT